MSLSLSELQQIIRDTYGDKDRRRGVPATFMWFVEEVGELATALRSGSDEEKAMEFADVLAWLAMLANGVGVDLDQAVRKKYGTGCPGCSKVPWSLAPGGKTLARSTPEVSHALLASSFSPAFASAGPGRPGAGARG